MAKKVQKRGKKPKRHVGRKPRKKDKWPRKKPPKKIMKCNKCNGTDHERPTNKKCPFYKPRMRQMHQDEKKGFLYRRYTVKTSLKSWCRKDPNSDVYDRLVSKIRSDVDALSNLYIEASLLYNFKISKKLSKGERFDEEPNFSHLFQEIQTNSQRPLDPDYANVRLQYDIDYNRNFALMHSQIDGLRVTLQTAAMNCIIVHMRARVRKWMKYRFQDVYLNQLATKLQRCQWLNRHLDHLFYPDADEEAEALDEVLQHMSADLGVELDFNFFNLETEWWKFYPIAFRLQQFFTARGEEEDEGRMKSFRICPIASHGHKHILYTAKGLHYLMWTLGLTQYSQFNEFSNNALIFDLWCSLFNVSKWHKPLIGKTFAMSFSSNGIDVSIMMQRKVRRQTSVYIPNDFDRFRANHIHNREQPEQHIGIDPGRINMFSAYTREVDTNLDFDSTLKGSQFRANTHDWDRRQKRHWMSVKVENDSRAHAGKVNSKDATRFREFTRYRLRWFKRKQKVYGQWKMTRLKWEKHRCKTALLDKLAGFLMRGKRSIVFWGDGDRGVALGIRGHIRPPCGQLYRAVQRHPLCIAALMTHERYSSAKCSDCLQFTREYEPRGQQLADPLQNFPATRIRVCTHCNGRWPEGKLWNRDINGARNILLNAGMPLLYEGRNRLLLPPPQLPPPRPN